MVFDAFFDSDLQAHRVLVYECDRCFTLTHAKAEQSTCSYKPWSQDVPIYILSVFFLMCRQDHTYVTNGT